MLVPGCPAPWFKCRTRSNPSFSLDAVAGRYMVLFFFGSSDNPASLQTLQHILFQRARFDGSHLAFFGISTDLRDESKEELAETLPGVRYFWDFDQQVSQLYGAVLPNGDYQPVIYVLDPALRILATYQPAASPRACADSLMAMLAKLPAPRAPYTAPLQAPVLVLPRIFEPDFCRALVAYYEDKGGQQSGFMRQVGDKTVLVNDPRHKRRRDCVIEDEVLQRACTARIRHRLIPELHKAFQFTATHIERHIVACYDAADHAHFRAHRDNTTPGTAHRRFAVSLFLNSADYEGGYLRFPEFGPALYRAPQGGAVVFSCSLLHEATPVTKGRRYMYLPFLYDEPARQIRKANLGSFIAEAEPQQPA